MLALWSITHCRVKAGIKTEADAGGKAISAVPAVCYAFAHVICLCFRDYQAAHWGQFIPREQHAQRQHDSGTSPFPWQRLAGARVVHHRPAPTQQLFPGLVRPVSAQAGSGPAGIAVLILAVFAGRIFCLPVNVHLIVE
jgi:hypothetical protein